MKYHLVQLGCQMNRADGERMATVFRAMGYQPCEREEDAQLLALVACSVRQKAIDKVYSKISKWNDWKRDRHVLTLLSGCVLEEDREKFLDRFDLVISLDELPKLPDLIAQYGVASPHSLKSPVWMRIDPEEVANLPVVPGLSRRTRGPHSRTKAFQTLRDSTLSSIRDMQASIRDHGGPEELSARIKGLKPPRLAGAARPGGEDNGAPDHHHGTDNGDRGNHGDQDNMPAGSPAGLPPVGGFWQITPSHASPFEAFVPIQNGCNKFCTFCAVPYTRGREVSRDGEEILAEVRQLVESGYTSITLLGQNVNSWGKDKNQAQEDFTWLLDRIGRMGQESGRDFWVYFTSPHPRDMTRDVLETVARHPHLAKQIHLPLQSGDDKVLLRMNRNHDLVRYREIVGWVRELMPEATLFTDLITGFSGETEEQFERSRLAMLEFDYQMAYIAMYSPRPGAASSRWEDDVSLDEKKRRFRILTEVLHQTGLSYNQKQLGKEHRVLVEAWDPEGRTLAARTEGKVQVRIRQDQSIPDPAALVGKIIRVRITSVQSLSMEGIPV